MEKFSKMVNSIKAREWKDIESEAKKKKKDIKSETLNEILHDEYPEYANDDNTQRVLFSIWSNIIKNAAGERSAAQGISRAWIKLYTALDKVIKALYQNENTSENTFTKYRKVVRDKYGNESQIYIKSTHILGVSRERALERREEYQNKVSEKGLNRRKLPPIYDDEIYAAIDAGINSSDPLEKAIAVMLNTGSRQIEVLKVSTYSETKDNPSFITVKGIAKDRSKKGYENKVVIRPLINLNAEQVVNAVKYVRDNLNLQGDNDAISSRYNQTINKRMKRLFPTHPELTAHKCRYIAGQMAYLLHGGGGTENAYIQQYLGHEEGTTSRTYQSINVRLRHEVEIPEDIKLKISKLTIDDEKNMLEHKEIKEAINQIKAKKIKIVKPDVDYPQFINPRSHLGDVQKIKILTALMKKAKADGVILSQADLKKRYGYGSSILTLFWKLIREGKIII